MEGHVSINYSTTCFMCNIYARGSFSFLLLLQVVDRDLRLITRFFKNHKRYENIIRNPTLENKGEEAENHRGSVEDSKGHAAAL